MRGSISYLATERKIWLHDLGGATQKSRGKIVNDAIEAHADLNVDAPEGPSKFLYANKQECRKALERDGFHGESIIFETHLVEWDVPTPRYLFEAERDAGVRTTGLLAHQASNPSERLKFVSDATRKAIGSPFQWPRTLSSHRNVERQIDFVGMKLEGRAQSRPLEEDDAEVAQPRAPRRRSSSLRPPCSRSSGCRSRSRDCLSCPDRYPREKVPTRPDFAIVYSAAD